MAAMNTIALDTELVTLTTDGAVATLTLNRPDARNALSLEMIAAMEEALGKIESGLDDIRVMVLAGAGKGFCAGMDLKAVQDDPILVACKQVSHRCFLVSPTFSLSFRRPHRTSVAL